MRCCMRTITNEYIHSPWTRITRSRCSMRGSPASAGDGFRVARDVRGREVTDVAHFHCAPAVRAPLERVHTAVEQWKAARHIERHVERGAVQNIEDETV